MQFLSRILQFFMILKQKFEKNQVSLPFTKRHFYFWQLSKNYKQKQEIVK